MPEPESFDELARDLRESVGDEFRRDAEEGERLAQTQRLRNREIADVVTEAAARGQSVTIAVMGRTFVGRPVYASNDLVRIVTPAGVIDIDTAHLDYLTAGLAEEKPQAGLDRTTHPSSFKARLLEAELDGSALSVGAADAEFEGSIMTAASDHILFKPTGGHETLVPRAKIAYLIERSPRRA